jgi:hypothetical protein
MPLEKSTLSPNPFLMQNQQLIVEGLPTAKIITRGSIASEVDLIERPDKTAVPSGRLNTGTFAVTLDLADNQTRAAFIGWANMRIDQGQGIDPRYKRNVTIVFGRLYSDSTGTDKDYKIELRGCFPISVTIPEGDIDNAEACLLEMELHYDEAPVPKE